jgi:hypothetical protein
VVEERVRRPSAKRDLEENVTRCRRRLMATRALHDDPHLLVARFLQAELGRDDPEPAIGLSYGDAWFVEFFGSRNQARVNTRSEGKHPPSVTFRK